METTGDIDGHLGGAYDDHLTEKGRKQAEELAKKLSGKGIERIFSSPYFRARETAEIISEFLEMGFEIIQNIRERNKYGILSGMIEEEALNMHPELYEIAMNEEMTVEGGSYFGSALDENPENGMNLLRYIIAGYDLGQSLKISKKELKLNNSKSLVLIGDPLIKIDSGKAKENFEKHPSLVKAGSETEKSTFENAKNEIIDSFEKYYRGITYDGERRSSEFLKGIRKLSYDDLKSLYSKIKNPKELNKLNIYERILFAYAYKIENDLFKPKNVDLLYVDIDMDDKNIIYGGIDRVDKNFEFNIIFLIDETGWRRTKHISLLSYSELGMYIYEYNFFIHELAHFFGTQSLKSGNEITTALTGMLYYIPLNVQEGKDKDGPFFNWEGTVRQPFYISKHNKA